MYYDRNAIIEFPNDGVFYRLILEDPSVPPHLQVKVEEILTETKCNIQQANSKDNGGYFNAAFRIHFPYDMSIPFPLVRGVFFKGDLFGMKVVGEVIGLHPTQLGKCTVYIKDISA